MSETYPRHHEETVTIAADPATIFTFVDDHRNLAGHMNKKNMMMAGSDLKTTIDGEHGKVVGSHIRMDGRVAGIPVELDEVVTERDAPTHKAWETVGTPKLIVIGPYKMGLDIRPASVGSTFSVSIDYALPEKNTWLGKLFSATYARWCVHQMTSDVTKHFRATPRG